MADKPHRDINDVLDDLAPKGRADRWRKTRKSDVFIAGLGVVILFGLFASTVFDARTNIAHMVVSGIFGILFTGTQFRTFLIVYRKYQNGDEIQKGFFGNSIAKRPNAI